MLLKYLYGVILAVLFGLCTHYNAVAEGEEKFRIDGRALVYGVRTEDWTPFAHVLLDGQEHVGFVRFLFAYLQKQTNKKQAIITCTSCHAIDFNHYFVPLDLMEVSQ